MDFILASNNKKKLGEMQRILSPLGINVVTAKMLGIELKDVVEDADTFEGNARIKAKAACKATKLPAIADDSGICVDYLDGAPGVYSARFSGGGDEDNNDLLLKKLEGVPTEKRGAHYTCAICCVFPDGKEINVQGECYGYIGFERDGNEGFGYAAVRCQHDHLTGFGIAQEFCPDRRQRTAFRCQHKAPARQLSDAERTEAVRVADSNQFLRGHEDQRECALKLRHGKAHGILDGIRLQPGLRDEICDDLGVP